MVLMIGIYAIRNTKNNNMINLKNKIHTLTLAIK